MLAEAEGRLCDAEILSRSLAATSDSAELLRILALEVLLKTWLCAKSVKLRRNHNYRGLWDAFEQDAQDSVLLGAAVVDPGRLSAATVPILLSNWETVFKKARYYYEFYEDYSLHEQHELGQFWISIGAPESEAEVRYFPEELRALTHGLIAHIRSTA